MRPVFVIRTLFAALVVLLVAGVTPASAASPNTLRDLSAGNSRISVDWDLAPDYHFAYCSFDVDGVTVPGDNSKPCTAPLPTGVTRGTPIPVTVHATFVRDSDAIVFNDTLDAQVTVPLNSPPTIGNVRHIGTRLVADAADSDGVVASCQFEISGSGDYSATAGGSYQAGAVTLPDGSSASSVCIATLPEAAPEGQLTIQATARDNVEAETTVIATVANQYSTPVPGNIALAGGTLLADVSDDYDSVVACYFEIGNGQQNISLSGAWSPELRLCQGPLPSFFDDSPVTGRICARDTSGTTGCTNLSETLKTQPLTQPVTVDGNMLRSTLSVAPGRTLYDCGFDVYYTYEVPAEIGSVPGGSVRLASSTVRPGLTNPSTRFTRVEGSYSVATGQCLTTLPANMTGANSQGDFKLLGSFASGRYVLINEPPLPPTPPTTPTPEPPVVPTPSPTPVPTPTPVPPGITIPEPTPPADPLLACSNGRLIVTNLRQVGNRAVMTGVAPRSQAGQRVLVRGLFSKKGTLASGVVQPDGTWTVKAPLPAKRLIPTNKAMYQARLGSQKSIYLKLTRYLKVERLSPASGRQIELAGRVDKKYPGQKVDVIVSYDCGKGNASASLKVDQQGRFRGVVTFSGDAQVVTVRLRTRAKNPAKTNKGFYTYSITQPVALLP